MYEKLKQEMARQEISANRLAMMSFIASGDFYAAINGKKPFYPKWRSRIADALGVPESELFDDEE